MTWRVANSLLTARGELDALYPHRPKTGQEGTIGNTAHVAEGWTLSDHNPWVELNSIGVVRAWDIDCTATAEQIAEGVSFDPNVLAEYLAQLQRDWFFAFGTKGYVIWNRRITTSGNPGGVWQPYHGSDPHDRHIHVSVGTNPGEYDSTAAWNLAAAFGHSTAGGTTAPIGNVPTDELEQIMGWYSSREEFEQAMRDCVTVGSAKAIRSEGVTNNVDWTRRGAPTPPYTGGEQIARIMADLDAEVSHSEGYAGAADA